MRRVSRRWVRVIVVGCALAVFVSPWGALRAQASEPIAAPPVAKPIATAVAAKLAAMPASALKAQDPGTVTTRGEASFFSSPKGVAVIVLMAAGVGYAVYSAKNDRDPVKSPIR